MKRIFQILAIVLAIGALVQTISAAQNESKSSDGKEKETIEKGLQGGPGI